jgi:thioredoxin 1
MPVYDTPITTDESGLQRVLNAGLPVVLYLFRAPSAALDEAFIRAADEYAGDLLVAKVSANENPSVHARYGSPALPALLTIDEGEVESQAANIRPADVDAHVDFLMGMGPYPQETTAEAEQRAASGGTPVHVSDATFQQEVLNSDVPVVVDFWAPWCGPCHMIAPSLEKLAAQYAGQVKIAKLNVDENQRTAAQYQVQGIPMLLLFKGGKPVNKLVGAQPQPSIEQMIRQAL